MKTSIIGFPRIGENRELKFVTEKYFRHEITQEELQACAKELRYQHWNIQKQSGLDVIPSNDFSFYDTLLDTAVLFNIVPKRYRALQLSPLDEYFAMARGYQGDKGDVKALAMKKWFNTNYHYMVPEFEDDMKITLCSTDLISQIKEANALDIQSKPVIVGAFTFLKLLKFTGKKQIEDIKKDIIEGYRELLKELRYEHITWLQFDEPYIVSDLSKEDIALFKELYVSILEEKQDVNILCQTYFGDIRDCYQEVVSLGFDGIGLDFVEGKQTLSLLETFGFPKDKTLFAGVVNGKNIWRNHYHKTMTLIETVQTYAKHIVLSTTCSLQHVPYTTRNEVLSDEYKQHLSFAYEKLEELQELKQLSECEDVQHHEIYIANEALFSKKRFVHDEAVKKRIDDLKPNDFTRLPAFKEREVIQREVLQLPMYPTTTIGSFPQTKEVRKNRSDFKKGLCTTEEYENTNKAFIKECIRLQEELDLDVLVHGEFERNDMVEYFGEQLSGYLFTKQAWVQSYGTRCVKPPIIYGDISREKPMSVDYITYAQSLSKRPVKGMLTGPVTILNWSFPREDITLQESAYQIAFAIRDEVLDLERAGINIIQVDEAALREKLPLRKSDWHQEYLDWAIPAFRLVHSGVNAQTQIHTHMCYSEFDDIIESIDAMDADVITFEASRSDLRIVDALKEHHFQTQVGPGVYDIHSPRVPSIDEICNVVQILTKKLPKEKLWINPDCGLKTRGYKETIASLQHMVEAAKQLRNK